ncbi:17897_t:CDS:1, partial [Funneliformis caledonium]
MLSASTFPHARKIFLPLPKSQQTREQQRKHLKTTSLPPLSSIPDNSNIKKYLFDSAITQAR